MTLRVESSTVVTYGADPATTLPGASVRMTRSVPLIAGSRLRAGA